MSLITKLWFLIVFLVLILISGSVVISGYTSKQYFEEQLFVKNMDNANMLGLTLSSLDKTPVNIEMFIGSQFDVGHYSSISLIDPNGKLIAQQQATGEHSTTVPNWFKKIIEPNVKPGVSQVADGWNQYGSLYVHTDKSIAIEAMWSGTKRRILILLFLGTICAILGSILLRKILLPLKDVVKQARLLGEMQFIQLPIPSTLELRKVVEAMNGLSMKFKRILNDENQRLDTNRYKTHFDKETLFANREYFLTILAAQLSFRDTEGNNCLVLFSIQNFKALAVRLAPELLEKFLLDLANTIKTTNHEQRLRYSDVRIGRLSLSDFAVLITEVHELDKIVNQLNNAIEIFIDTDANYKGIKVNISAVQLKVDESAKDTISRADKGILEAIANNQSGPTVVSTEGEFTPENETLWREKLTQCIKDGAVRSVEFPVINFEHKVLHYQSWSAILLDGKLRKSGYYTHWARHLNLLSQLEFEVIKRLLAHIQQQSPQEHHAVLLSESFILDTKVLDQFYDLLTKYSAISKFIFFEVRESTVANNPKPFREFCQIVKMFDSKIGLKRVGESFSELIDIQELGLNYVKIDSAFVHDIHINNSNQSFIKGFTSLAHSFDIEVFADGVNSIEDSLTLISLGLDGEISNYQNML